MEVTEVQLDEFDYDLPSDLIAQEPAVNRTGSRMMVVHRETGKIKHKNFTDIYEYFIPSNLVVFNNTKVFPARLYGRKKEGEAQIEVLLTKEIDTKKDLWEVMMQPARRLKIGDRIEFSENLDGVVTGRNDRGRRYVRFEPLGKSLKEIVEEIGCIPLPPYIKREGNASDDSDRIRYQTVFARKNGSIAAPTAGLHFDGEAVKNLRRAAVETCEITLSVGPATFTPVNTERISDFKMERETYEISRSAARKIETALIDDRSVAAVGTTVVRSLESNILRSSSGRFLPAKNKTTDLFITPGFKFKVVSKLLTNFHLPKSTLIMLVSAFAGKDLLFRAYEEAIEKRYRFYSYGDCMLII